MEEKRLQLQKSDVVVLHTEPSSNRRWELTYAGKDRKIYLTDREKEAFENAVLGGAEIVKVGGMLLTKFFQYLMAVREKKSETVAQPLVEMISEEQREANRKKIAELKVRHKLTG